MKVLDLHCPQDHVFEGWFASEDDFQDQVRRGLVECPCCGSAQIGKRLSAPRLNLGAKAPASPSDPRLVESAAPGPAGGAFPDDAVRWVQLAREIIAQTEDVGRDFPQEVRRMHYGEVDERAIRGQASPAETAELLEEGINVLPLPWGPPPKETLN
ncbi:MAG: DUF1178 family protein [Burkholderiaceae bacterium]|nr:DUF1178 family protein [Burkholderiaceae bacterium]